MALKWSAHALVLIVSFLFIPSTNSLDLCPNKDTKNGEKLPDNMIPTKVPTNDGNSESVCDSSGSIPNVITTFDGVKYDYNGTCNYTLLTTCDGSATFKIYGKFEYVASKPGEVVPRTSVIRELFITVDGERELEDDIMKLSGFQNGSLQRAGNLSNTDVIIYCNVVVVKMSNGVTIYWVGAESHVVIAVPASRQGLCGLCGNNNGIKYDDLSTKEGNLVSNIVSFRDGWGKNECDSCDECNNDTLCEINPNNIADAEKMCAVFKDADRCGEYTATSLYAQCKNYLCAILPDPQLQMCPLIEPYLEACEKNGVEINLDLNGLCGEEQYVCEGNELHIKCPAGQTVSILSALYGRKTSDLCTGGPIRTTDCSAANSLDIARQKCQGQQTCDIEASNIVFRDPCSGTVKYLQIHYSCKDTAPERKYVCEHNELHIECPAGQTVSILSALYGRQTSDLCTGGPILTSDCSAANSLDISRRKCEGQQTCNIEASNTEFEDPCVGTLKYLQIDYSCEDAGPGGRYACEHNTFHIECPAGQTVSILSALYGRKTSDLCTGAPILTSDCSAANSLDIARQKCEGQQTCDIEASNNVFGDPCVGTLKYLQIDYSCDFE